MKTILVLAQHPEMADTVRAGLNPEHYRVVHRRDAQEAEPLLGRGMTDACLLDVELGEMQALWGIEKVRRRQATLPIIVYAGSRPWEWEEDAYLQGVAHVLTKPVRPRLLNALLERLWTPSAPREVRTSLTPRAVETVKPAKVVHTTFQALEVLRDFSGVLTHSLSAEGLLREFLLLLREITGVNRAAIFLRQPATLFAAAPSAQDSRRMRSACAIGLSPGLLEHFDLSFEAGIGGHLFRHGRILRRESEEVQHDFEMQKEFELLGAQVVIPILDRETLVGVAAFDGRVTGEPLVNGELELIFHLLEELGMAVKNIWLHDQLAANNQMMGDVLRELTSACVVVNSDLTILHANKTARNYFARPGHRTADLEFTDLPQLLGGKIFQVLKTGAGVATFKYQPPDSPQTVYHVTVVPFQRQNSPLPNSVLLVVDDHTQSEQLQRLEIEAASLRLIRSMADRMAHEIGNALVPLSTHQQLLQDKFKDPDFRASLDLAMADGVKRISRLTNQMRYLARDSVKSREAVPLARLIDESFREAQKHLSVKKSRLNYEEGNQPIILAGDHAALKHALAEVMLNALQANPADAMVSVRTQTGSDGSGGSWVHVEIADNGAGFSAEAAQKLATPFFTTRNVGLGLGLAVCRKVIESHQGNLTVVTPSADQPGVVRISLPLVASP